MWKFEHSVECHVGREFAWKFWSNVDNWADIDPAIESVTIDGPFVAGAKGITKPPGQEPIHWVLADVADGRRAVVEISLPGALSRFYWLFEDATDGSTRITQTAVVDGERAGDYAEGAAMLENGIPQGMEKLAQGIIKAANSAG
jgi:hypothetical protein